MKALTIWQPHASLIIAGAKPEEYRPRAFTVYPNGPKVGQRIVIHASARPVRPNEVMHILGCIAKQHRGLRPKQAMPLLDRLMAATRCQGVLPLSMALGTAVLGEPRAMAGSFIVPGFPRRPASVWAWPLTDIEAFPEPVPMRGFQGFWDYPVRSEAA
jgi:hypothetical protein